MRARQAAVWTLFGLSIAVPAAADLADVKKAGALRVVVNLDRRRPEFFAEPSSARPGFDQEVLRGFASLHRVTVTPVFVNGWDALIPALLAGKGDVIAGRFTATDTRRKLVDFTNEVFPYRLVVINRKPRPAIQTVEQLRRERVGTSKGTIMVEVLDAAGVPASTRDETIPTGGYVEALKSGRVTAAVWGVESAIASQHEDPDLQLGMFIGDPGSLAYGVRKGDAALLAALNAYIDDLRHTPTWSRLVVKYFGEKAPEILRKARSTSP
jgi:ABC-type amino acid transport substrate-binding protein